MKKSNQIGGLLLMFVLMSLNSMAQNEYLENDPVWTVHSICQAPLPCINDQQYNYFVNGDTTINNLVYKKIFRSGTGYIWSQQAPPNPCNTGNFSYVETIPSFYLRSAGKKMFIYDPGNSGDSLLYDFDLNVGDTLPLTYNNFQSDTWISSIDSISTPYGYRKRFSLTGGSWAQYLIEGIGHSKGLVEPLFVPLECGFDLICFSLNDTAYFPATGPTCFLAVGESEAPAIESAELFPNPANRQFSISFPKAKSNASIFLVNALGQKICLDSNFNGNKFSMEVSSFKNGIYFLQVIQDNEVAYSEKLLITH